ncbi:Ig-like domain repeat protein [Burkholderia sp. MS455]|uniref:Ig-like domain-containing protein n=1 Tax=Burkholderia sp. MS455 TaxID=2811788 RepID=UPI00195BFAF4|nr:Ig-like domain-containing protein [Burkholderia sp. MS455]QRR07159.1 Ig-like domain repeat protein [Burkholderia sp. MS455]
MDIRSWVAAIGFAVLAGCGDGGGVSTSEPPANANTQVAKGTLEAGVRVLTAQENAQIIATSDTSVTFNALVNFLPGSVFLTNDTAYQVVTSSSVGGKTVVTVQNPPVEAVFSSLQITGKYQISADQEVTGAGAGTSVRAAKAATTSTTLSFPVDFSLSGISGNGSVSTTLGLDVDYQFDAAAGGLKSGHIAADETTNAAVTLALSKGVAVDTTIPLKQFSVPIPLTVYDSVLNLVGVRLASIYIPVNFVIHGGASLESKTTVDANLSITATTDYVAGAAPISTGAINGTSSVSSFDITTAGDPVLALLTSDAGLYLNPRPALAALNTVALLGADIRVGPNVGLTAKVVANTPPYCAQITEGAHGGISGFFKTIGVSKTTKPFTKDIQGFTQANIGSCKFPTTTGITIASSTTPLRFGDPVTVSVTVAAVDTTASGGKTPTGAVQVTMGPNKCSASLVNGSGRCTLPASPAGTAQPVSGAYGGDANFDVSTASTAIAVERAMTIVTLSASPNPAPSGSVVMFTAIVSPNPDQGQSLPTGTMDVVTDGGATICTATLNNTGIGKCSATMVGPSAVAVSANYSGDPNYVNQSSTPANVTFTPCSPVGSWWYGLNESLASTTATSITIRPDLTGATIYWNYGSIYCEQPMTVSVQGNMLSSVVAAGCGSPAYTESLTFAADCKSASGTSSVTPVPDLWVWGGP